MGMETRPDTDAEVTAAVIILCNSLRLLFGIQCPPCNFILQSAAARVHQFGRHRARTGERDAQTPPVAIMAFAEVEDAHSR